MLDTHLQVMSMIIGIGNPLSALLTGPVLARFGASPTVVRRAQGAGWVVLAVAQVAFVLFGITSGLVGFRYAQPLMLAVAALNFSVWWSLRPKNPPRTIGGDPMPRRHTNNNKRSRRWLPNVRHRRAHPWRNNENTTARKVLVNKYAMRDATGAVMFCSIPGGKPSFGSQESAQAVSDGFDRLPGGAHGLRVYPCGDHFHLTSQPQANVDEPT